MRRGLLSCPENTRRAARVINVPPPYKVLNFRSVRKRNISRNTGTAATETLQYIRPGEGGRGENYSADEDVNIGELYRSWARAQGGHAGHGGAYCFDKRVDGSKFIADFAKVIFSSKR